METNPIFELALLFVTTTKQSIFLTGKAGTGKTTFLKQVKNNSTRNSIVVAPTGVAAINAEGITIHSLFQLPFGPIVPQRNYRGTGAMDLNTLLSNIRFDKAKRELLTELEQLIIDEVSMVRADVLDAIDAILRFLRKNDLPFGGVQVILIGDLFQLPPVIGSEMSILSEFYESLFFFEALVFKKSPLLYLELTKVYRQQDENFVEILNKVRNNTVQKDDLDFLNQFYNPNFVIPYNENIITLTSHNIKADTINRKKLDELPDKVHVFEGILEKDFNEKALPADMQLKLKKGAQVMFIKNDVSEHRRYYNGKLAIVKSIDNNTITISTDKEDFELSKEIWKSVKYNYNSEDDRIEEEEIGSFTQYPLRLAWAVTIHKSQGLTFDKAIIDAGDSFASGQVYVALSRLTSTAGLVLFSKINPNSISTDARVLDFTRYNQVEIESLQPILAELQNDYLLQILVSNFSFERLISKLQAHAQSFATRSMIGQDEAQKLAVDIVCAVEELLKVGNKFCVQLNELLHQDKIDFDFIYQRIEAASSYFIAHLTNKVEIPLNSHYIETRKKTRVKKYLQELNALITLVSKQLKNIKTSLLIIEGLKKGIQSNELWTQINKKPEGYTKEILVKKEKLPTGSTQLLSYQMYKEGKTIEEIAKERGFVTSTIEGHLATFIVSGEIAINELVPDEKVKVISETILKSTEVPILSSSIKAILGDDYSYGEIKAVLSHLEYCKKEKMTLNKDMI